MNATLFHPWGVAATPDGCIVFADCWNNRLRMISADGRTITTIAGCSRSPGFGGDGGLAIHARLFSPTGVAVNKKGDIFVCDTYGIIESEKSMPRPR